MKNEYGVPLDRNGYAPSVITDEQRCFICGRSGGKLDRHEVWHGAYRDKSKALGCWVPLCGECHDRLHHKGGGLDGELKEKSQSIVMEHYGWEVAEFRSRFGKSYI